VCSIFRPTTPVAILPAARFDEVGIQGAVESDFFDWILETAMDRIWSAASPPGGRFSPAGRPSRCLKSLYESLIDPASGTTSANTTRRLAAAKITARALTDPLSQASNRPGMRFRHVPVFTIRLKLAAAEAAGWARAVVISACVQQVRGLDVHPVR